MAYLPAGTDLRPTPRQAAEPDEAEPLTPCRLRFVPRSTVPHPGSAAFDSLNELADRLEGLQSDAYDTLWDLVGEFDREAAGDASEAGHHISGHAANVSGDMPLQAQLVTNGLYCGGPDGYEDPRAADLAAGAADWVLCCSNWTATTTPSSCGATPAGCSGGFVHKTSPPPASTGSG